MLPTSAGGSTSPAPSTSSGDTAPTYRNTYESLVDPVRAAAELTALRRMDSVLGVLDRNQQSSQAEDDGLSGEIEAKIAARAAAKSGKDWATADAIRDELTAMGIAIKDGADGTTWSRIVE